MKYYKLLYHKEGDITFIVPRGENLDISRAIRQGRYQVTSPQGTIKVITPDLGGIITILSFITYYIQ